jgi:hypothetical protein
VSAAPETWRPIPGYESRYSVSDLGRVRGEPYQTRRLMGRGVRGQTVIREITAPAAILSQSWGGRRGKYRRVQLHDWSSGKNRRRYAYVHALVLAAFVGPRPDGAEILHGEGGPSDNRLANLAYGSREENRDDEAVKLWLKNNPGAEPAPF